MRIREVGRDCEHAGRGGKLGCDALEDLLIAALRAGEAERGVWERVRRRASGGQSHEVRARAGPPRRPRARLAPGIAPLWRAQYPTLPLEAPGV